MKAQEYFDKYAPALKDWIAVRNREEVTKIIMTIAMDFTAEMAEIGEKRNITTDKALNTLIREMNIKWNALVIKFELAGMNKVILKNGFQRLVETRIKTEKSQKKEEKSSENDENAEAGTDEKNEQKVLRF